MTHIVLDDEQAAVLANAASAVELRDRRGNPLGVVTPADGGHGFTEEEIREAKRRLAAGGPRYTTAEVLEHLRSLDAR